MKRKVLLLAVCSVFFGCRPNNPPTTDECSKFICVLKLENPEQQKHIIAKCTDKWVFPVGLWLKNGNGGSSDAIFSYPYIDLAEGYVMVNWLWEDPFSLLHPTVDCFAGEQLIPVDSTQYCYLLDYEWADGLNMPQSYMARDTTNVVVIQPYVGFYSSKTLEIQVNGKLVAEDRNSHEYSLRYGCVPIPIYDENAQDRLDYIAVQAEWKAMLDQLIREDRLSELGYYYF